MSATATPFKSFDSRHDASWGGIPEPVTPNEEPEPSQPMTFAERAALVTRYGEPVMPLEARSKDAFLESWPTLATTDREQIEKWNRQDPAYNCGVVARRGGYCFFEIDDPRIFARIEHDTGHSLEEVDTLIVKSSGAKRHFHLKHNARSEALGNVCGDEEAGHGKRKELFSFRALNEYVVSPGSIHPITRQPYEILHAPTTEEIPAAPDWLLNWIENWRRTHKKTANTASVEPEVVPEGGRDNWLFAQACKLRDNRYSKEVVLTLLRNLNQQCCNPPMLDSVVEQKVESAFTREPRGKANDDAVMDGEPGDEKQPDTGSREYPSTTIDGDLIGELTRALTDGTFIPPQFVRENLKVALGSVVDGLVGFPNHEDLHTREYLHNVSVYPQSGKGESYKRTSQPSTGSIFELLKKYGVSVVDGGKFGSGEFMVKVLKDAPTHRAITRFDEMSEVWAKNRAIGCTLEKKLLTLFESTSAAQGSFKNGVNTADDFRLSLVGDFTKESFDASFTGSGSRGSGYLSRCVFQFADRRPWEGDWLSIDTEKVRRILSDIDARLATILNSKSRSVPTETAEAKSLRLEFYGWLDTQDPRLTPRLKDHLKRDALLRAVLGGGTITAEMMRRSIEWCRNQLDNRLALFPEDAGSPTEIMERIIIKTLKAKGQASDRELKRACHVDRAGSGGHETFNRAIRSLTIGHEIKTTGKTTRKGFPIYALFDAI